jgi:hypothetical protein
MKDQLYLAAVLALLLLVSLMNGYLAVAIATLLLVVGIVIYPNMRRIAIASALAAAGVAAVAVLLRSLLS